MFLPITGGPRLLPRGWHAGCFWYFLVWILFSKVGHLQFDEFEDASASTGLVLRGDGVIWFDDIVSFRLRKVINQIFWLETSMGKSNPWSTWTYQRLFCDNVMLCESRIHPILTDGVILIKNVGVARVEMQLFMFCSFFRCFGDRKSVV